MTPPRVESVPLSAPHPRGIFEADHTFPGQTTFRVYDCAGRLLERREMESVLVDGQTRASLEWVLEHFCPADPVKHAVTCSGVREPRLRVLP